MSAFEVDAVQRLFDQATAAGVPIPEEAAAILDRLVCGLDGGGYAAREWARLHPDATPCCEASAYRDMESCTCWVPVFDVDQQPPALIASPAVIVVRPGGMCGDCAYRPGSPERADEITAEHLMALPSDGKPFFCHQGIRPPSPLGTSRRSRRGRFGLRLPAAHPSWLALSGRRVACPDLRRLGGDSSQPAGRALSLGGALPVISGLDQPTT